MAYEDAHPEDVNVDVCPVCGTDFGRMIECDGCETWTHTACHRTAATTTLPAAPEAAEPAEVRQYMLTQGVPLLTALSFSA